MFDNVINIPININVRYPRGYSSVVEHSTADREVPGSNPGAPLIFNFFEPPKYVVL
jgi:hypothetical protein